MANRILRRGIETVLRSMLGSAPVLILEGGRAVGKTTLCRQLLETGLVQEYVDLTDQGTLDVARHDPLGFVRNLRLPVVIDEAQLAENLTLAVKQRVDELEAPGLFLLTGSVRLGRGALGGSDPLAGRAARLRLHSFTVGERKGTPIDFLPRLRHRDFSDRRFQPADDIVRNILVGGLPTIPGVVTPGGTPNARRSLFESYVESVIHLAVGESRSDRTRLLNTFKAIASTPALILNLETLARDLGISSPTLKAYLQVLENSFLIEQIPALADDARREVMGHPRLIPSDVALAAWAGRHSADSLKANPTSMGPLLHALVAGELCAQASWSEQARVLHWRRRNDEVDVVLEFPDGDLVGVEVKAARSVNQSDAAGLRSFLSKVNRARHGVLFYLGERSFELESGIWAVPVQALWDESMASTVLAQRVTSSASPVPRAAEVRTDAQRQSIVPVDAPSDAALFVSYVHADDEAEGGRIVQLARDLGQRYRLVTGEELETFIDKDDLRWGDEWRSRLDQQLARTTFFVPVVTPRFLRSEACRSEVLTFVAAADTAGVGRFVLPIMYIRPATLDDHDPVAAVLTAHQWVDWTNTRYEEATSGAYRRAVDQLCERLADAVAHLTGPNESAEPATETSGSEDEDLLLRFEHLEAAAERLPALLSQFTRALTGVGEALTAATSDIRTVEMHASARHLRTTLRRLSEQLNSPSAALDQATSELRTELSAFDSDLTTVLRLGSSDAAATELFGLQLRSLRDSLPEGSGIDRGQIEVIRDQMRILGRAARELRGPTRSIEDAFLLVTDVETMLDRWRHDAGLEESLTTPKLVTLPAALEITPMNNGRIAYLSIKNAGPTDSFQASVRIVNGQGTQLPYHPPWREQNVRTQMLVKGDSGALTIAEIMPQQGGSHDLMNNAIRAQYGNKAVVRFYTTENSVGYWDELYPIPTQLQLRIDILGQMAEPTPGVYELLISGPDRMEFKAASSSS